MIKMTTINAKIRNQANKIIAKYNGYRKPQDITKMYTELSEMGVTIPMFAGNTTAFEYNGEAVENSRFVYQAYEMPESDNVEYNMYIS